MGTGKGKWEMLLTSRKAWLALLAVSVAIAKWAGVEIPPDVFAAIEVVIVAFLTALGVEDHGLRSSGR